MKHILLFGLTNHVRNTMPHVTNLNCFAMLYDRKYFNFIIQDPSGAASRRRVGSSKPQSSLYTFPVGKLRPKWQRSVGSLVVVGTFQRGRQLGARREISCILDQNLPDPAEIREIAHLLTRCYRGGYWLVTPVEF